MAERSGSKTDVRNEAIADVIRELVKKIAQRAGAATGENEKFVDLLVSLILDTIELVRKSPNLTPAEVSKMMAKRLAERARLLDIQTINCILATALYFANVSDLRKTVATLELGLGAGLVIRSVWLLADAVEPAGECYLAYQDYQGAKQVEAFRRKLEDLYRNKHPDVPWDALKFTEVETVRTCSQLNSGGLP